MAVQVPVLRCSLIEESYTAQGVLVSQTGWSFGLSHSLACPWFVLGILAARLVTMSYSLCPLLTGVLQTKRGKSQQVDLALSRNEFREVQLDVCLLGKVVHSTLFQTRQSSSSISILNLTLESGGQDPQPPPEIREFDTTQEIREGGNPALSYRLKAPPSSGGQALSQLH